jgi:hypothetical protein
MICSMYFKMIFSTRQHRKQETNTQIQLRWTSTCNFLSHGKTQIKSHWMKISHHFMSRFYMTCHILTLRKSFTQWRMWWILIFHESFTQRNTNFTVFIKWDECVRFWHFYKSLTQRRINYTQCFGFWNFTNLSHNGVLIIQNVSDFKKVITYSPFQLYPSGFILKKKKKSIQE